MERRTLQAAEYVCAARHTGSTARVWPWVVGILGAFILGIVAISIAAAILRPRWLRSRMNEPRGVNERNTNQTATRTPEPQTQTARRNVNIDIPPPTDQDQVLAQLSDLENDWTLLTLTPTRRSLDRILADDYVGPAGQGGSFKPRLDYIERFNATLELTGGTLMI